MDKYSAEYLGIKYTPEEQELVLSKSLPKDVLFKMYNASYFRLESNPYIPQSGVICDCPFCKQPSMIAFNEQTCWCYYCEYQGNSIDLLMSDRGWPFDATLEFLIKLFKINVDIRE